MSTFSSNFKFYQKKSDDQKVEDPVRGILTNFQFSKNYVFNPLNDLEHALNSKISFNSEIDSKYSDKSIDTKNKFRYDLGAFNYTMLLDTKKNRMDKFENEIGYLNRFEDTVLEVAANTRYADQKTYLGARAGVKHYLTNNVHVFADYNTKNDQYGVGFGHKW